MNVVMVAAECAPWSKTGGLGDVSQALPKALAARGHRVMCVVPLYEKYEGVEDTGVRHSFNVCNGDQEVGYFHRYQDGVDWVFVDHWSFQNAGGGRRIRCFGSFSEKGRPKGLDCHASDTRRKIATINCAHRHVELFV